MKKPIHLALDFTFNHTVKITVTDAAEAVINFLYDRLNL